MTIDGEGSSTNHHLIEGELIDRWQIGSRKRHEPLAVGFAERSGRKFSGSVVESIPVAVGCAGLFANH